MPPRTRENKIERTSFNGPCTFRDRGVILRPCGTAITPRDEFPSCRIIDSFCRCTRSATGFTDAPDRLSAAAFSPTRATLTMVVVTPSYRPHRQPRPHPARGQGPSEAYPSRVLPGPEGCVERSCLCRALWLASAIETGKGRPQMGGPPRTDVSSAIRSGRWRRCRPRRCRPAAASRRRSSRRPRSSCRRGRCPSPQP